MRFSILLAFSLLCVAIAPRTTAAQSVIDSDATVVELRVSCAMPNSTYLDNCFETAADVTDWLWGTGPGTRGSEPNSLDSVTVRVGPGSFGRFDCEGTGMRGFVSVEGAGRDLTRFVADVPVFHSPVGACRGGVTALGCTNLSFRNFTAEGAAGVLWTGAGDSQWQDVDMFVENEDGVSCLSEAFAWYDVLSAGGLHFFWNTRFEAVGSTGGTNAFRNNGAEVWAYGSDFLVRRAGNIVSGGTPVAVQSAAPDGMRLFGSTVRGKVEADAAGNSVLGIEALNEVHMHGGIISIDASAHPTGGVAIGISAGAGALVHTPDTAFALKGATKIRLLGSGTINAPFLWPSGTTPPNVLSRTGADLFVKTNEGPGQNEPRLLVYDSGCSAAWAEKWRNMTTGNCI